jgi:UDP-2-acetamido-3-amino-2,3-dideoxy-glucuronate N-acetyltransferase
VKTSVRVGLAGAGYWGANIVRVASGMGVLAAVCDSDTGHLEQARRVAGDIRTFASYADLLRDPEIDAVVLAVPAPLHAAYALEAIAAGKDVFVEKPLALNVADAQAVAASARACGRKVFVGHLLLYHAALRAVLEKVEERAIGKVVHVRSRRLSWGKLRDSENVWWSFAPHDVALVLALFQRELPLEVNAAHAGFSQPGIADFAYADLGFTRGRTAHIEVGWLEIEKSARLDVYGTHGAITFIDSREGAHVRLTPGGVRPGVDGNELWRGPSEDVRFTPREPLEAELSAFLDWIRFDREPPTAAQDGVDVVRILALAQRSADEFSAAKGLVV